MNQIETSQPANQEFVNQVYAYAANLLLKVKRSAIEVEQLLISQGLDAESASVQAGKPNPRRQKGASQKNLLHGGLWGVGGAALTVADIGFIFWGVVICGSIRFFKGLANGK